MSMRNFFFFFAVQESRGWGHHIQGSKEMSPCGHFGKTKYPRSFLSQEKEVNFKGSDILVDFCPGDKYSVQIPGKPAVYIRCVSEPDGVSKVGGVLLWGEEVWWKIEPCRSSCQMMCDGCRLNWELEFFSKRKFYTGDRQPCRSQHHSDLCSCFLFACLHIFSEFVERLTWMNCVDDCVPLMKGTSGVRRRKAEVSSLGFHVGSPCSYTMIRQCLLSLGEVTAFCYC